jgi:hypothetical protein
MIPIGLFSETVHLDMIHKRKSHRYSKLFISKVNPSGMQKMSSLNNCTLNT